MNHPRVRFTVRRMMAMVLVFAVTLHLSLTAYRVFTGRTKHMHTSIVVLDDGSAGGYANGAAQPPFWPCYWRGILGMPWRQQGLCKQGMKPPGTASLFLETCEYEDKEICVLTNPDTIGWNFTQRQLDLESRLMDRYQAVSRGEPDPFKN